MAEDMANALLKSLQPFLASRGFRRKGQTFISEREDVFLLVNLQRSTTSTKDARIVTLNLGVYSKSLAAKTHEALPMSIWTCHWRQRIGHLLPERRDQWWKILQDGDMSQTAAELRDALERYGLNALEDVASTERLRALWQEGRSPGLTLKQRLDFLALLDTP